MEKRFDGQRRLGRVPNGGVEHLQAAAMVVAAVAISTSRLDRFGLGFREIFEGF